MSDKTAAIRALTEQIAPIMLRHFDAEVIGGALADLVAMWVLAHRRKGGLDSTEYQRVLLEGFVELVIKLMALQREAERKRQ